MLNLFFKYILVSLSTLAPLGLDWQNEIKMNPQIPGYRYYSGSMDWGTLTYTSKVDVLDLESEIQIYFSNNRITNAILIFGPRGLNDFNCILKYKQLTSFLSDKYGTLSYMREVKDPIVEDLITTTPCHTVFLGLYEVSSYWNKKGFLVEMKLLGDSEGYYIEIYYSPKNKLKKTKKTNILKKL